MKILFGKSKSKFGIGSLIIMFFEKIKFSHVAVEINGMVYESVFPKSRIIPRQKWDNHYKLIEQFEIPTKHLNYKQLHKDLNGLVDIRYSVMQLVLLGIEILIKPLSALLIKTQINGSSMLICTEFVGQILEKHFSVDFKESRDMLSLKDIYNEVEKLSHKE